MPLRAPLASKSFRASLSSCASDLVSHRYTPRSGSPGSPSIPGSHSAVADSQSARQSRRRLEVVQRETADVDRAGNKDVTNEDKSERRLAGGELFAEVLEMKSRRL